MIAPLSTAVDQTGEGVSRLYRHSVDHRVFIQMKALLVEIGRIAGVAFGLTALCAGFGADAVTTVAFGPVVEEIQYRGVMQTSIEGVQKSYNFIYEGLTGRKATADDKQRQLWARVLITGLVFGMAHDKQQIFPQILGGVAYGLVKEKTHSLVLPILLHAFNNAAVGLLATDTGVKFLTRIFRGGLFLPSAISCVTCCFIAFDVFILMQSLPRND